MLKYILLEYEENTQTPAVECWLVAWWLGLGSEALLCVVIFSKKSLMFRLLSFQMEHDPFCLFQVVLWLGTGLGMLFPNCYS